MRAGAELRFATDDPGYLIWALERLTANACFHSLAECPEDWRMRPAHSPETRYEAKAKEAGRVCTYLRFVKRERCSGGSSGGSHNGRAVNDDMQN
jgi:tRNA (guanine-N7-)-methyltransferase